PDGTDKGWCECRLLFAAVGGCQGNCGKAHPSGRVGLERRAQGSVRGAEGKLGDAALAADAEGELAARAAARSAELHQIAVADGAERLRRNLLVCRRWFVPVERGDAGLHHWFLPSGWFSK